MTEREQARGRELFFFFSSFCQCPLLPRLPCLRGCCSLLFWTLFLVFLLLMLLLLVIPVFLASGVLRWRGCRYGGADIKSAVSGAACSTRSTMRGITDTGPGTTASASGGCGGDGRSGGVFFDQAMSSSTTAVAVSAEARIWAVVLCIQNIRTLSCGETSVASMAFPLARVPHVREPLPELKHGAPP